MDDLIAFELEDGIGTLTLQGPKLNALSPEMLHAVPKAVQRAISENARALVVTGSGKAFSAGVDLFHLRTFSPDAIKSYLAELDRFFMSLFDFPGGVVMAINGHAIAGGTVLAACGDRRICVDHDNIKIGLAELAVGVPFPASALEITRRLISPNADAEVVLQAALFGPVRAQELGLVDRVVPAEELMKVARAEAARFAAVPSDVFEVSKRQLQQETRRRIKAMAEEFDRQIGDLWASDGVRSNINAYLANLEKAKGSRS